MRFLIVGFSQESNCFSQDIARRQAFEEFELVEGKDMITLHRGKHTVIGGFIDGVEEGGHELVPSISAKAVPSGPVDPTFYSWVKNRIIGYAVKYKQLDGILLSLHGAMSVYGGENGKRIVEDPEGDIVASLRKAIGHTLPIVSVFDLHSDTSELLLNNTTVTLAYNEEPHRDLFDRGIEAARLIPRIIKGEIRPVSVREHPPMLLPGKNMATDEGPMYELHQLRSDLEKTPGVIDISIHGGFFGSDQRDAGFSVVCTTDGDKGCAEILARQVALAAWHRREDFMVQVIPLSEAIHDALSRGEPVGLLDEADDPAGGASGDSVAVLRAMVEGGVKRGGISAIKDCEVVKAMAAVGEGSELTATIGGKTDKLHGDPIEITGRVAKIFHGRLPISPWDKMTFDVGLIGVLDVDGILVVVTERKAVTENIDIFGFLGYDVKSLQVVGFKGLGPHIRQALQGKIHHFIRVDGIGITHSDLRKLPYKRVHRPLWPLDDVPLNAYQ